MDKFKHIDTWVFDHIDTWVFDLDNTLYDAQSHIFVEIGKRMTGFVADHLKISHAEADKIRKEFYQKYGTTLRGMMTEHGVAPDYFLKHVHDVNLGVVPPCAITREYLSHLPGRKFIFTNAPISFAKNMTAHLGIDHHFDGIFAIEHANYWPKPDPRTYNLFLEKHAINPKTACMFEDMQVNLKPAHDLGMTTVWFHGDTAPPHHEHVHHKSGKLPHWLQHTIRKK